MTHRSTYIVRTGWLFSGLILALSLVSCTGKGVFNRNLFKARAAETPAPSEQGIEKAFFVDGSGKPKSFLCAWAPEMGRGAFGEALFTHLYNQAMHCNVEWEITENFLVAKMIHPSYPNDRNRWKEALKIPITSHYYYEREKDAHGRETNEWIENSSRSHWSARPMMKLDLSAINILDFGAGFWGGNHRVTSVDEIEWDREQNFLGFSINTVFENVFGSHGELQGKFRINFLKFDHDPSFKKIPFHQENARYMNILHVMGRKIEGIEPELYAARWDVRKPTKVYLNGVPREHEKTVIAAVEKWNATLRKIGAIAEGQTAFIPVVKELKYPFDLRYPAINWISDRRISINSPLGVGMAHSDVRNGKIIWGGVVLYGGLLEMFVNRYAPLEGGGASASESLSPMQAFSSFIPNSLSAIKGLDQVNLSFRGQMIENMAIDHRNHIEREIVQLQKTQGADEATLEALREQLRNLERTNPALNRIAADLIEHSHNEVGGVSSFFEKVKLPELLGATKPSAQAGETGSAADVLERQGRTDLAGVLREKSEAKRQELMYGAHTMGSPFFIEHDRTVENLVGSWMASSAQSTRSFPEMLESVVMDLSLHEIGHFLGLGHQFKENVVPAAGTVPSRYVKKLGELATREKGFTNYSSVMGYRSGRVELLIPSSDLAPGPHDELALRYLYKGEYATYDKRTDDWRFIKVPESGRIPQITRVNGAKGIEQLPVAYFPSCNDYEATLAADPYCNRWDYGTKAVDIVTSYFENISDNLLANLYSLVGGGGNHWYREYRMWSISLDTFSRVRLFYDEMRRRLRSEPRLTAHWDRLRNDKAALFEFSQACQKPDPTNPSQVRSEILRKLFAHEDIRDLCRANALALNEFRFFLNLPEGDYTRLDHDNRYISGGYLKGDVTHDFGHIFGSWFQLSNFPLKFSTMFTLTSADPYQFRGYGLSPNFFYDSEENRVLYRTLYPREYTRLISDSVQNNMRFAATGMDSTTTIGRTVLATSALLPRQRYSSNDSARLPRDYNDMLDQQTQFQLGMVAVLITPVKPDASSNVKADHYKKFTATVYDFFTGRSTTAREVYILPKGDVVVWANGMFIYPVTKMKFYEGSSAYVVAYKVAFDYEEGDQLVEDSVKSALLEKHNAIIGACIEGFDRHGLAGFFDSAQKDFEGIYIPPGIDTEIGKEKTGLFYESVEKAFDKYENYAKKSIPASFPLRSMRRVCDEAVRGIGQIASSAALINGFWLSITPDYLEK